MPRVVVEPHARLRMRQRGVSDEDIAYVWLHYEQERPTQEHPGYRVRIGRTPAGHRVGVVARLQAEVFEVKTVW